MTPNLDQEALHKALEIVAAHLIITGAVGMAWWRKGSAEEDAVVAEANGILLDGLADATTRYKTPDGEKIRDAYTIEQAEDLHRERELRRFGWKRN